MNNELIAFQGLKSDEFYVATYYLKTPTARPIAHVFGPFTQSEARRLRKHFLQEHHPEGAVSHVSVHQAIR